MSRRLPRGSEQRQRRSRVNVKRPSLLATSILLVILAAPAGAATKQVPSPRAPVVLKKYPSGCGRYTGIARQFLVKVAWAEHFEVEDRKGDGKTFRLEAYDFNGADLLIQRTSEPGWTGWVLSGFDQEQLDDPDQVPWMLITLTTTKPGTTTFRYCSTGMDI